MTKYINKPIPVEAVKWQGFGKQIVIPEVKEYDPYKEDERYCTQCALTPMSKHGWIETLEGGHIVCPSDWIITGVRGEKYPVKNDIFLETYVLAEAQETTGATNE